MSRLDPVDLLPVLEIEYLNINIFFEFVKSLFLITLVVIPIISFAVRFS